MKTTRETQLLLRRGATPSMNTRASKIARLSLSTLLVIAGPTAQSEQNQPVSLTEAVSDQSVLGPVEMNELTRATQAASIEISEQQENVLRWNLVVMSNLGSVVDRETGVPAALLRLTIFPDAAFLVKHSHHRLRDWSINWYGDIVQGGSGTVHISIVPGDENKSAAFVNVQSDLGDFNIWPTDLPPYSIAAESVKWHREPIDSPANGQ